MIAWPFILFAWQLDLALCCLDAWELTPAAVRRLEAEVHPVAIARRRARRGEPFQDDGRAAAPMISGLAPDHRKQLIEVAGGIL